ncbi:hypothetical protein SADUNF_Sadunf15G0047300 [Salix dunnii]|uniref:Uncharacterized protein n=1 Tax=Salix dunnii TaxID=1413687 RepID=A0A835JC27_9ROSI|nr:hypothetical protein SADUNF_Sadunf15G0047300 [Salix dunnii]
MSTPLTMTRLVRWRVRDWASCLLARRFSLGDEHETFHNSSSKLPVRKMVFGVKKDSTRGGNKSNKKLSKKNKKFRQVNPGSPQATINSSVSVQNCNGRDSSRPPSQDEEYIVFCFGEDGGFDVVKEWKSSETLECLDTANYTSPRSVNRKVSIGQPFLHFLFCNIEIQCKITIERLNVDALLFTMPKQLHCVEVSETIRKSRHQRRVNGHETEKTPVKNDEEAAGSHSGPDQPCNARKRGSQIGENDSCGTVSAKSSDSNQSDGSSRGSFSFPVMHWELIGSPVQMPKAESLYARKHSPPPCARFQCLVCMRGVGSYLIWIGYCNDQIKLKVIASLRQKHEDGNLNNAIDRSNPVIAHICWKMRENKQILLLIKHKILFGFSTVQGLLNWVLASIPF